MAVCKDCGIELKHFFEVENGELCGSCGPGSMKQQMKDGGLKPERNAERFVRSTVKTRNADGTVEQWEVNDQGKAFQIDPLSGEHILAVTPPVPDRKPKKRDEDATIPFIVGKEEQAFVEDLAQTDSNPEPTLDLTPSGKDSSDERNENA